MLRCSAPSPTVAPVFVAAVLASACLPRQTGDRSEATAAAPSEAVGAGAVVRRCGPVPAEAIATLSAGADGCGLALTLADEALALVEIPTLGASVGVGADAPSSTFATGSAPAECGPGSAGCELWGHVDALGPIVLVTARGPESGVATQVWVGWVEDGRLGFAPTWFGLPSVADHTRVGPPWALGPYECGGGLVLLPSPRLPEAEVEGPSEELRAAAGRWTVDAGGEAILAEPRAVDPSGCRPLFTALP